MSENLPPCPESPNCVSSQETRPERRVAPIAFACPAGEAAMALRKAVEATRGLLVVSNEEELRAQYRSRLGFVDDVRCIVDASSGLIHIRSASRLGWWDLGVNRRRVERIRREFARIAPSADQTATGKKDAK
ncbi:protein of unknown function DUF1499 [Desulfovibrio sp. X2]|uniref:DUF1499 domain-containing protein n=1 Tax=Desulfovibrio sp. X2 TaxID=941449 RepID=UPI0003589407|nr:DUF1499 domain-containing protein [Desulfovibrio sp. X2]EPR37503.1 protein of unknown function DUF1499 [Desulfovibrio sp. X2]